MSFCFLFLMGNSSYQKIVFRSNVANNHPNTTSEPIEKTSPSQQISRVLMSCLFNYDGASQTFSLAAILVCFHQRWRPAGFCAAQSLFLLCLFIPVFISPRSPQSSSYLLRLCQSHPSMLIPASSPPAGSHRTLQVSLCNFSRGAGQIEP